MTKLRLDEIGYWSEVKLAIIREYALAYSIILNKRHEIQGHIYIDAFAGAGVHISRASGDFVPGSPLNALNITPKFTEFHFIDLDGDKAANLQSLAGDRSDVHIYKGDCNQSFLTKSFLTRNTNRIDVLFAYLIPMV